MKRKINWGELPVEKTLLGLPHIEKAASETKPNPRVKRIPPLLDIFNMSPADGWT